MLVVWPITSGGWMWLNNVLAIAITIAVAIGVRWILVGFTTLSVRKIVRDVNKQNDRTLQKGKKLALAQLRAAQRAHTIGAVLRNIVTWVVICIAAIIILKYIGVDTVAIVASAGVGAAVLGFGAQNVVKDIINGLFIVFEDQYGVGDVIDTGLATGTVEDVGVRITTLRDDQGVIWFVRNGEITRVGNKSYKAPAKPQ